MGYNLVLKEKNTRGNTDSVEQENANDKIKGKKKDPNQNIEFNAAHVLADQFLGSGYKSALNLITTSGEFNKRTMGTAEKFIKDELLLVENAKKVKNPDSYITFDISVTANWNSIATSAIVAALSNANPSMTKEQKDGVLKIISDDQDPKLVNSVFYEVNTIYTKDKFGKTISIEQPNIEKKILADEVLRKILK